MDTRKIENCFKVPKFNIKKQMFWALPFFSQFFVRHISLFTKQPTFSKFMDLMADSIDLTTPAIDPVTCYNQTRCQIISAKIIQLRIGKAC